MNIVNIDRCSYIFVPLCTNVLDCRVYCKLITMNNVVVVIVVVVGTSATDVCQY